MSKLKFSKNYAAVLFVMILCAANLFGQSLTPAKCAEDEDFDAQIAEATKGIEFSAYNLPAFLKRGSAYYNKGNYEQALDDFQKL